MNSDERRRSHRSLLTHSPIASGTRFMIFVAACLFCFQLFGENAFGQTDYESHLSNAVNAQAVGNIAEAIPAYQSALAIRGDDPKVWANLGLVQHQAGDHAGALASFTRAYQLQPNLFVPLLFLGIENLQMGNKTEAVRYLSKARQLHSNDIEVYMNLGRAYFGLKQFENASLAYRYATELDPKNGEAWYRLGITYLEMSEVESGELAALNRQSPFFQRLYAESLSDQDKLAEATETFRTLLSGQHFPVCTRASFGLLLLRRGELSEAQAELQKDSAGERCSLAELGLIRVMLGKGETEAAFRSLASLWTLDHGFIKANASELTRGMTREQIGSFNMALAQIQTGNLPPEAISVLRRSLQGGRTLSVRSDGSENKAPSKPSVLRSPADYSSHGEYSRCAKNLASVISSLSSQQLSLLAACSFFTGDYKDTLLAARKLLSLQAKEESFYWSILADQRLAILSLAYAGEVEPNSIRLHELLAETYRDREKYAEAEAEYKVALSINPDDLAALVGAATNYLQELRIDLASEMVQHAITQNPLDAEANYVMGEVLIAEHKFSDAELYLKKGLTTRAELIPRIHALLGQVYAIQGDTEHAIDEYKLGLPSDDDGSVHYQLGRVYKSIGEAKLADEAFVASKTLNQRKQIMTRDALGLQQRNRKGIETTIY